MMIWRNVEILVFFFYVPETCWVNAHGMGEQVIIDNCKWLFIVAIQIRTLLPPKLVYGYPARKNWID